MFVLERDIERKLVRKIKANGGVCIKLNPFGNKGIPDRLCLAPHARICFVETKRPNGKLKKHQVFWKKILERMGFKHWHVENNDGIERVLDFLFAKKD